MPVLHRDALLASVQRGDGTGGTDWRPDEVVLLPLYPQYSGTTTGSSLTVWREAAARAGLVAQTSTVCCYPTDAGYVAATAGLLRTAWQAARAA